ncbi:MAG: hypothetical protein R3C99_04155 [Pirellulaceae bacterium]
MPRENQSEVTFDGLVQFLGQVGFRQSTKINDSLAFYHQDSGTVVVLSVPQDGLVVRSADLLSILVRLETKGIVDTAAVQQLKSGKLPKAS